MAAATASGLRIGMTYDLREDYLAQGYGDEETAEFDHPETIRALADALEAAGHGVDRIGPLRSLVRRLANGESWDLVFNIAEGLHGFGREAQVPALLEAYGIPYTFSDALVMALTLHKGLTKHILRDRGIPTPAFVVIDAPIDLAAPNLSFPLFAKPVAEGTGKGVTGASKVHSPDALARVCRALLENFHQPVLVEEFLPGREFTVGIIGTGRAAEVVGVMEVQWLPQAEGEVYSFANKEHWEDRVVYRLAGDKEANAAGEVALAAWRVLGCRDAGRVDLRSDARGNPNFIEVNPLAGLRPGYSDLPILCGLAGMTYQTLIERIVASALARHPATGSKRTAASL
jgi:D-alanine-D-alanine ligase